MIDTKLITGLQVCENSNITWCLAYVNGSTIKVAVLHKGHGRFRILWAAPEYKHLVGTTIDASDIYKVLLKDKF